MFGVSTTAAQWSRGYTLVEIMLVMGIISALFGISSVLISDLIPKASVAAYSATLLGDIRQQQVRAMAGDDASPQGIRFDSQEYTLFSGSTYNANDPHNFVVEIEEPYSLTTTFSNGTLLFEQNTGAISGYSSSGDTITVVSAAGDSSASIELNSLGVPTQAQ